MKPIGWCRFVGSPDGFPSSCPPSLVLVLDAARISGFLGLVVVLVNMAEQGSGNGSRSGWDLPDGSLACTE
jgi:hypothetical protein